MTPRTTRFGLFTLCVLSATTLPGVTSQPKAMSPCMTVQNACFDNGCMAVGGQCEHRIGGIEL